MDYMAKKCTCSQPHGWWWIIPYLNGRGRRNSRQLTAETLHDVTSYKSLSLSDFLRWSQRLCYHMQANFKRKSLNYKILEKGSTFSQWVLVPMAKVLLSLQERQKWHLQKQNFRVGNIVLLKVDAHQNNWPMAKIICACPNKDDVVWNVLLLVGSCNGTKTVLDRPIHKIVLLVEAEKGSPTRRLGKIKMIRSLEESHVELWGRYL